jgi:methylated-DNA-[protein]-cysteine S-methyltransferase
MKASEQQYATIFTTDIATIGLQFDGSKLTKIDYFTEKSNKAATSKLAESVRDKIKKYLDPQLNIKSIKVDLLLNVTPFQEKVLQQLQDIPYGETKTYGEIAKKLNTSPRAVGNACRNNPVPIIIPCHRVVAANGIGGYDGATKGTLLAIKYQLLKREGVLF